MNITAMKAQKMRDDYEWRRAWSGVTDALNQVISLAVRDGWDDIRRAAEDDRDNIIDALWGRPNDVRRWGDD
jgi:hypothetical protein